MPKKAKYSNTAYLTDPLYTAFELYVKEHPLPHFKDCVVSFLHIYDASLSAKRVRDYDNLDSQECKRILDTVACFLLTDDSGIFVILSIEQNLAIKMLPFSPSWKRTVPGMAFGAEKCAK